MFLGPSQDCREGKRDVTGEKGKEDRGEIEKYL